MFESLWARLGRSRVATAPSAGAAAAPVDGVLNVQTQVQAQPPLSRRDQFLSLFDSRGHGLEIGPSFNPLLPKSAGYDVKILDHASQSELVAKYRNAAVDVGRIEVVDYVSDGGSLVSAIGQQACFDFIVASHVVEHTVDLLGFLKDCEQLLKPDGVLVLAVPDKRCSFDALRPVTTTGAILQAHLDKRSRHSLGALFDEVAYNCLRAGSATWGAEDDKPLSFAASLQAAKGIFEEAQIDTSFHDIHAWQFTPSSFRLIANDLREIGYVALREKQVLLGSGEFFITLSRNAAGPAASRMELAEGAIAECRAIKVQAA